MASVNENFLKLQAGYLFPEIGRRTREFQDSHPDVKIYKLGIGNTTEPLVPTVIEAMHKAVDDLSKRETYNGYGPEQGYQELREKISEVKYKQREVDILPEEVFVSDGAKPDCANILELFKVGKVGMQDPSYPVYVDSCVMDGWTGEAMKNSQYEGIIYMSCTEQNSFIPNPPEEKVDLMYLCFPNNPTGAVATKAELKKFVDYAIENEAVIVYDAAYEPFIRDKNIPHSIYEVSGAKECAIEINSFSKWAGFTGVRCGWT